MNNIPNPKTPAVEGHLAVDGNVVSTKIGTAVVPLANGDTLNYDEADAGYFEMANIPLTRVGDNTYLPLDVKSDFKGAIQPWGELPYFLQEADGSIAGLRPGYNGEFARTFYAYSESGAWGPTNFRLTDSEYRPTWLAADEFVNSVFDGNEHGFCIRIKSTTDLNYIRFYWVDHNNTLDSKYHSFLDITANMTATVTNYSLASATGGVTYIPEIGALVICLTNNINRFGYAWFTVNRPFQTIRSSSTAAALPAKSVDWTDLSGALAGTGNVVPVFDAPDEPSLARYFKFINEPSARSATYPVHPSAGPRKLSYAIDNGVIRLMTPFFFYIAYTGTSRGIGWTAYMDYTIATNRLRYNPVTDDPVRFQQLPWVINASATAVIDKGPAPTPMTDLYRSLKYPIFANENNLLNLGNNIQKIHFIGSKAVASYVGTSGAEAFAVEAHDLSMYAGATPAAQKMDMLRRPFYQGTAAYPAYQYYDSYDASVLSKSLAHVRFVGPSTLAVNSSAKLYGGTLTSRGLLATLPNLTTNNTVYSSDFNSMMPSMALPSTVSQANAYLNYPCTTSFVNGNGAMIVSRANYADLAGAQNTVATWLAYNINATTGVPAATYAVDPTTFLAKLAELDAATIAQSTHVVTGTNASSRSFQNAYVDQANGFAYFLYTLTFGNTASGIRYEYAIVRLTLSGGNLVWPGGAATAAVISRMAGGTVTANLVGPGYFTDECLGVYRHTDGTTYIMVVPPAAITTVGGNYTEVRMMKLTAGMAFSSSLLFGSTASWYQMAPGIHPTFGFYYTSCWFDSQAKSLMYYKDYTATATQATRLQQSAEAFLTGSLGSSTVFALSSRSATGFVLYSSEISVFMNGKRGIVPTQTIQLNSVVADPSNKTFYFYVQWNGTSFVLTPSLTVIPESTTSTFVGTVITGATGVVASNIQKVTRLDTYRFGLTAPIIGSAIRGYENQPAIQAYVYDTTAEVDAFKSTHVPPAQTAVFNSWDRTSGNALFYPGGVGATGDAAAWTFQTNPDRVVQPNNTSALVSFISPQAYDNYEFETTLSSTNADDDVIGVVAAYARVNDTTNLQLMVWRTGGGWAQGQGNAAAQSWNFGFSLDGATLAAADKPKMQYLLVGANRANAQTPAGPGWAGVSTRVRVVRRGNIITAKCSDWSSDYNNVPLLDSSEISLDLSTIPQLAPLTGSAKYGYTTISQAQATYYNTTFSGGLDTGRVIDLQTNTVWKYSFASSTWTLASILPKDELGYVRTVTNPDTGETYFVTQDAVIKQ